MIRDRAVVVGGGIGGMAAALLLADAGFAVELAEAGPRLGAGWRSVATPHGPADLGIRVPRESGDPRADALIFHADPELTWHDLGAQPREGHVALGRLNADTPCPDARMLPGIASVRAEVIARADTPDPGVTAPHLAARWDAVFGPTILDALLRPACRAAFGVGPEVLAPHAAEARIPARVVIADREETDWLRRIGALAARLAHPRSADAPQGGETRRYLYPRDGGIGRWIEALERALGRAGVRMRTGARVAALRKVGARVVAVGLDSGEDLPLDLLVLAAAPHAIPGAPMVPESSLPVSARLLVMEGGAPPPLHWIASFDPGTPFLRVGFVDRLDGRDVVPGSWWRVVVEVRGGKEVMVPLPCPSPQAGEGSWWRGKVVADIPLGTGRFAVETVEATAARHVALDALREHDNLAVLRSAAGGHALAGEVIADAARLVAHVNRSLAA